MTDKSQEVNRLGHPEPGRQRLQIGPGIPGDGDRQPQLRAGHPISRYLAWGVDAYGAGVSFQFTDGVPASGLAMGTPAYSSDGGATWTLAPVSGGGGAPAGFDGRVTDWRLPLAGTMGAGRQFTLTFQVMVK